MIRCLFQNISLNPLGVHMRLKNPGTLGPTLLTIVLGLFQGACDQAEQSLQLGDLRPEEYTYIERLVVLERAKAVALTDRQRGIILLDSLAVSWGDSVESETARLITREPHRAKIVHELLKRIVEAEKDSLLAAPLPRRVYAPLPDPLPKPKNKDQ